MYEENRDPRVHQVVARHVGSAMPWGFGIPDLRKYIETQAGTTTAGGTRLYTILCEDPFIFKRHNGAIWLLL